jgi:protein phosphatase
MNLAFPDPSLILLVGASGSGKSTFAARHFLPTEIISTDLCRAMVCDDENDQAVNGEAFSLLKTILQLRLRKGRLTVVDSNNLRFEDRRRLLQLGRQHDTLVSAVLLDTPPEICLSRNAQRSPGRAVSTPLMTRQARLFDLVCQEVLREKYHCVYRLSPSEADQATVQRSRLRSHRQDLSGPFDIIGDLHGCATELEQLLEKLGYRTGRHPRGRRVVFLGDFTDRGPRNLDCYQIVSGMVAQDQALAVIGNHDAKLLRYLEGRNVQLSHGLEKTVAELEQTDPLYRARLKEFLESLPSHYLLDGGRLAVAHAGIKEAYQGRASKRVRLFCIYGDTTGKLDPHGLPVRRDWAQHYRGATRVVYGHTPVQQAVWRNRTINIDTGCVFGGRLTALRYPELELVEVPALQQYSPRSHWLAADDPPLTNPSDSSLPETDLPAR